MLKNINGINRNLEHLQVLDGTSIVISSINRDYMKLYHQRGAYLGNSNPGNDFNFGGTNNYHQLENAYPLKIDEAI